MGPLYLFDDGKGPLAPLTDLRASFDIRTGALTQVERARLVLGAEVTGLFVPEPLAGVTSEAHPLPVNPAPADAEVVTLLNGRAPLGADVASELRSGQAIVEADSGDVIAARVRGGQVRAILAGAFTGLTREQRTGRHLLFRPWDVITWRDRCLDRDLGILAEGPSREPPAHCIVFGHHALMIDPASKVYPGVTFDLEQGPIVVAEGATIRPGSTLVGPAYVGPGSTVFDHAIVKARSGIGPVCKVAGEVGGVIFQGHANKAHDGHLGDSWVGEWVNLGAGTINSNLLNTYGEVAAASSPDGRAERTGLRFLGAILGDHVKTAIGTRIMTGCLAGTGTMWASSAAMSGRVPPFAWETDRGRQTYRLSKFLDVAREVMSRRHVTPGPAYIARLEALHGALGAPDGA
jgi:UDP-N-acetylglucosamine diphosphorylase/glucosamine-1-phosphate N-acetyltransferase